MLIKALIIAFSMYSKIPMPKTDWQDKSMQYALCFFPLVGAVIGMAVWLIGVFLINNSVPPLLLGCIMTVVPVIITGGIHLDGFLDTMDGISSYADKEKRLEILKDSNSGAFAIIGGLCYFTLSVGLWSCIDYQILKFAAISFTASRALSGLSVVCFPMAKKTGLAAVFGGNAQKTAVKITTIVFLTLTVAFVLNINVKYGLVIIILSAICYIYHYYNCVVNFGGITGDLAGYFLQIYELMFLAAAVILYSQAVI